MPEQSRHVHLGQADLCGGLGLVHAVVEPHGMDVPPAQVQLGETGLEGQVAVAGGVNDSQMVFLPGADGGPDVIGGPVQVVSEVGASRSAPPW